MEDLPTKLTRSRFLITEDSLKMIERLKAAFPVVRHKFRDMYGVNVAGISFFGSRTIGRERNDPAHPSDLDLIVFYDGTPFVLIEKGLIFDKGRLTPNPLAKPEEIEKRAAESKIVDQLRASYTDQLKNLGLPIDLDPETGRNKTLHVVDISNVATDKVLAEFKMEIDRDTSFGTKPLFIDQVSLNSFNLLSRFYLGEGEGLYANRQYILEQLERPTYGERYFHALMAYLQDSERTKTTFHDKDRSAIKREGLPPFPNCPRTISEAKIYFSQSFSDLLTAEE